MEDIKNIDLSKFIDEYKDQLSIIRDKEKYKWNAVKNFQECKFNLNSSNWFAELKSALKKTGNLLSSGNYLPKRMLLINAEHKPKIIKNALSVLYDESIDIKKRIDEYKKLFDDAMRENTIAGYLDKNKQHTYQDERAISVYLSLKYPDKYYFYKYDIYKVFCTNLNLGIPRKSTKGRIDNLINYWELCKEVKKQLLKHEDLINLYENTILKEHNSYSDPKYNLLVQDFIYTFSKDFYKETSMELVVPTKIHVPNDIVNQTKGTIDFTTSEKLDSENKNRHNILFGTMGELFVFKQEQLRLAEFKNKGKFYPKYIAKKDDFAGYDILSYNEDGSLRYIEVKTTPDALETPFYMSDREVEFSKQNAANYYLYRVYEFDKISCVGKIEILKGSMEKLAKVPVKYKMEFKLK